MALSFKSAQQERLFSAVRRHLEGLGYPPSLLLENYKFVDWFDPSTSRRTVPLAAFATAPPSYNTACIAVVLPDGESAAQLVRGVRALGAPYAFVIGDTAVTPWVVGKDEVRTKPGDPFGFDLVDRVFQENHQKWAGPQILRDKNIGIKPGQRQLDFIDLGLIPALEAEVRAKLPAFIKESIYDGNQVYQERFGRTPSPSKLFRTAFRIISAKVLHDRGLNGFASLSETDPKAILSAAEGYYRDQQPAIEHLPTLAAMTEGLWSRVSFANLSVEILAYIYENTFVDNKLREKLGIHGTPYSLARYMTFNLIDELPKEGRLIVEPCCGHGIFLVAALQRLRELMPPGMTPKQRHARFVQILAGIDLDPFSVEVAKLCLSLADFPSGNHWHIETADVFRSGTLAKLVEKAAVVLCNPPFRAFTPKERNSNSSIQRPQRPAELLRRTLEALPKDGLLGFILPRSFLDGAGYRELRRELAKRFGQLELVALPDRVFFESDVETTILLCKEPSAVSEDVAVSFIHIRERDREQFLSEYRYPVLDRARKTPDEAAENLKVVPLRQIWDYLNENQTVGDVAEVHRGIEYKTTKSDQTAKSDRAVFAARYVRQTETSGFRRGFHLAEGIRAFRPTDTVYLSVRKQDLRGGAIRYRWNEPKVIMSANRVSRDPWCVAAFADEAGLICYQNFTALWPSGCWTPKSLSAVLNSPVASAFIAVREDKIHIRIGEVINKVPIPRLGSDDIATLDLLVEQYMMLGASGFRDGDRARRLLLQIDAMLLEGYDLPPRLERVLLDYFDGYERPVSHSFGNYYPEDFDSYIPLRTFISEEYQQSTAENFILNAPKITDPAILEALAGME